MKKMVYEWGSRGYSVDAQIVGETVERITEQEGRCEPGRLVDVARDETNPIHPLFTWDNDDAAEKWRTHEARKIIGALTVTVKVRDQDITAPAFISVGHVIATQDEGEGYRPVSVVTADEQFAQEAIHEAMMRLRALKRRYEAIEALAPVWKALEALEAA